MSNNHTANLKANREPETENTSVAMKNEAFSLAVSIGNSEIDLGLFSGRELISTYSVTTPKCITADEARAIIETFLYVLDEDSMIDNGAIQVSDGIIGSVVPQVTDAWVSAVNGIANRLPLIVGPGLKTGLKMHYSDPAELGADRIADLVAATEKYGAPFIVVDLGTTTNFEIVNKEGAFIGGIIAPGLRLSAQALSDAAARLPVVDLKAPTSLVGKNTREAIQSGVVMGEVARIDGLIALLENELGYKGDVIATGEYANVLAALSTRINKIDDSLTLRGLNRLLVLNRR